jgi:hypothetical protein
MFLNLYFFFKITNYILVLKIKIIFEIDLYYYFLY